MGWCGQGEMASWCTGGNYQVMDDSYSQTSTWKSQMFICQPYMYMHTLSSLSQYHILWYTEILPFLSAITSIKVTGVMYSSFQWVHVAPTHLYLLVHVCILITYINFVSWALNSVQRYRKYKALAEDRQISMYRGDHQSWCWGRTLYEPKMFDYTVVGCKIFTAMLIRCPHSCSCEHM